MSQGQRFLAGARMLLVVLPTLAAPAVARAQAVAAEPCAGLPATHGERGAPAQRDSGGASAAARGGADVVLLAAVSAREIRFARQPEIRVRLCGGIDSARVVERRNLPSPIVVGTVYRDVYVAVEILGHLHAECLASALGAGPPHDATPRRGRSCASIELRAAPDSASVRRP
ncbi:MAG TPA: hypothetical protein VEA99_21330 [Gemmatimonadaceae bacterium]|nr:hypothetical protein [Gemmatimonadaceae bacterium]